MSYLISSDIVAAYVLRCIGLLFVSMVTICILFLPKLVRAPRSGALLLNHTTCRCLRGPTKLIPSSSGRSRLVAARTRCASASRAALMAMTGGVRRDRR